ncbi:MAG: TlpA family protein disulfide reductase [candidate division WOR-3 bacterium]|nr:MAG: TlpA family protein disulfide reductase [candidate division WOR-3 bacterium]
MKKLALILILPLVFAFADESTAVDAPDFTLEDVDGNTVNLDSLLTKGPVMMSFWALWCKMCIKELDALKPYAEEFDSLNITLLALSQDKTRSVPKVKPFATSHKWTYQVVLDPENMMRNLYNVQAMPTFFIIDQNKKIVFTHQGYKPGDEEIIVARVRELFKEGGECEQ